MENMDLNPPSFSNFGIETTMEMGNSQLVADLIAPETATASPDKVTDINEEPKKEVKKPQPPKKVEKKPETEEDDDDQPVNQPSPEESIIKGLYGEEEEEEEPVDEPVKKETEEDDDDPKVNQFEAIAKDLFDLGVLTKDEEEGDDVKIETPEALLERFNHEKKKGAIKIVDDFIGQFGEDYQEAFQAIYVKGVDPREYFATYNNIKNYAELDLSQETNQISVVKEALSDQGLQGEDLASELERIKNYGDLESTAKRYHKVLVKKEATKLQQMEQDKAEELQVRAAQKQQYAQNVNSILQEKIKSKEFDGIPINPKLATELQDFLTTDKYKTASGEKLTDFDKYILDLKKPENHAKKVKLALLLKVIEKDPTLATIQKSGVTKKTDQLFSEVVRQKKTSGKTEQKPTSWWP